MKHPLKRKLGLVGGLITGIALAASSAYAEEIVIFQDVPSADEVSKVLFGEDSSNRGQVRSLSALGKTRAIRMHNSAQDEVATAAPTAPATTQDVAGTGAEPKPEAATPSGGIGLGFNLQFAFDSTELLSESKAYIDRLGEVLGKPENKDKPILIVGHTDGSGTETYNSQLSERRAVAVRDYLTTTWSIDASRLEVQGAGETQLLDGTDPLDSVNRRVEFFAVN